jgi:hypothetical protein
MATKLNFFIHPLPLSAVVLLGINDHYLKYQYPGFITGKLSDFLGLFYFPLFVAALVLIATLYRVAFTKKLLVTAIVLTDLVFCALKLNPFLSEQFVKFFSQHFFKISVQSDPTDLIALLSSVLCYQFAKKYFTAEET